MWLKVKGKLIFILQSFVRKKETNLDGENKVITIMQYVECTLLKKSTLCGNAKELENMRLTL